jgi:hypothetical protein
MLDRIGLDRERRNGHRPSNNSFLRGWMGEPVGVRVPPSAPSQYSKGIRFRAKFPFFVFSALVANL